MGVKAIVNNVKLGFHNEYIPPKERYQIMTPSKYMLKNKNWSNKIVYWIFEMINKVTWTKLLVFFCLLGSSIFQNFPKKLKFITPWYGHVRNVSFTKRFAYAMNAWSLIVKSEQIRVAGGVLAIFSRIICTFCHYRPPKNMKRISPYSFSTWRYPCQWKHCNISTQTQCEITGSSSNQTDQNSSLSSNVVAYLPLIKELVWYVIYIHFRKLLFFSFLH